MNDKTEQSLADALRCTAAGGRAEIINVPGYPLMVRAVDYNTLRADLDRAIVNFGDAAATVCDMRAQLAEAQRELIAKEADRAGLELERNNAQRQHTMQCAINKTDSQRILELTAENEQLREQRNRVGLCIDRALNGGKKDDHEAGLSGRMDAIRSLKAQLAEAQGDAERLDWIIEHRAYVVSDPDCCDGYWLNYARPDGTMWTQATEHETPRAAIDAAKGPA